jgi:hypothetical protein
MEGEEWRREEGRGRRKYLGLSMRTYRPFEGHLFASVLFSPFLQHDKPANLCRTLEKKNEVRLRMDLGCTKRRFLGHDGRGAGREDVRLILFYSSPLLGGGCVKAMASSGLASKVETIRRLSSLGRDEP